MKQIITRANQKGWTEQSQAILNDMSLQESEVLSKTQVVGTTVRPSIAGRGDSILLD